MEYGSNRLDDAFFQRPVLEIAPELLGKTLVRRFGNGTVLRSRICEVEAYRGTEDKACHAHKGKTKRTEVMFGEGGRVYVYMIYGMYWMLNIVTGLKDDASAVLIRGLEDISGPGRVGKWLQLDKSFYGEDLKTSGRIWLEDTPLQGEIIRAPRIGIAYAGEPWISMPWRFLTCASR